jgi:hypothetical protein
LAGAHKAGVRSWNLGARRRWVLGSEKQKPRRDAEDQDQTDWD